MINNLIFRSFFTGFFAACIVGPVFTLVLYRTITQGLKAGLASASGMAIADGIFFFLATVSGLSTGGMPSLLTQIKAFEVVGGPLMIAFGFWTLLKPSETQNSDEVATRPNYSWLIISSMFLTLSNPLTLLFFGTIASQIFPDIASLSIYSTILCSLCLSVGSLTLLSSAILFIRRQKNINPDAMIKFFKTLSGIGLILTGGLLTFEHWASPSKNLSYFKKPFSLFHFMQ